VWVPEILFISADLLLRRGTEARHDRPMCAAADLAGEVISVASALLTKSGRVILEVLLAGRTDPAGLAELARGRLRTRKSPTVTGEKATAATAAR
jgi:hypothetical protein